MEDVLLSQSRSLSVLCASMIPTDSLYSVTCVMWVEYGRVDNNARKGGFKYIGIGRHKLHLYFKVPHSVMIDLVIASS